MGRFDHKESPPPPPKHESETSQANANAPKRGRPLSWVPRALSEEDRWQAEYLESRYEACRKGEDQKGLALSSLDTYVSTLIDSRYWESAWSLAGILGTKKEQGDLAMSTILRRAAQAAPNWDLESNALLTNEQINLTNSTTPNCPPQHPITRLNTQLPASTPNRSSAGSIDVGTAHRRCHGITHIQHLQGGRSDCSDICCNENKPHSGTVHPHEDQAPPVEMQAGIRAEEITETEQLLSLAKLLWKSWG